MRRVVSLIALCSMVLSVGTVLTLEAAPSHGKTEKKAKLNLKTKKSKRKVIKASKSKKRTNKVSKKKSKTVAIATESKDDLVVLNEPVIDGSKINESSIVVDKDIRLANNDEINEFADKDIKLTSNDEESVTTNVLAQNEETALDQTDIQPKTTVVAQLDDSEDMFKEKMQQINNNRKLYDLIRPPKKNMKDNIQVAKFREELEHYRKMYSSKLKKA